MALDPFGAHWQSLLGGVLFRAQRWPAALEAANAALELDPEDVDALNLQAATLRQLGRPSDARGSLRKALQQDPHEAWTHANLGWTCLQQGQQREAEQHFREALRLDPELEIARKGVVEAIKAKNPVYRLILRGFLWLNRRTTKGQWYLVLGAYLGYRVALNLAQEHPEWGLVLWPLVGLYIFLVVLTWFTAPLRTCSCACTRWAGWPCLRTNGGVRIGWAALELGLAFLALWLATNSLAALFLAAVSAAFAIPLAMTFSCSEPAARHGWSAIRRAWP